MLLNKPITRIEVIGIPPELAKIEVVGWTCQDRLHAHKTGVPPSVFSKILASVIFQVNHVGSVSRDGRTSHRISRFMSLWTPHRFGGVFSIPDRLLPPCCETLTGRAYLDDFVKDDQFVKSIGLDLSPLSAVSDDTENDAEPLEARPQGSADKRAVTFSINPSSRIRHWEGDIMSRQEYDDLQDLTTILVEVYSFKQEALNAFATCRTDESAITAIDTEFVHCKSDIERILSQKWSIDPKLAKSVHRSRACASQVTVKAELRANISKFADEVASRLAPFRLTPLVLGGLGELSLSSEIAARQALRPFLVNLTNLVASCIALLGCFRMERDPQTILSESASFLKSQSVPVDTRRLVGFASSRRIGPLRAELETVVRAAWRQLEARMGSNIPSPVGWYQKLESEPFAKLF